jgi:hypothetical protein
MTAATLALSALLKHKTEMFSQLPDDVLCKVMSFMDATTLCIMRVLNRKFKRSASKNSAGWDNLCRNLWKEKIHVSRQAQQELLRSSPTTNINSYRSADEGAMPAYRISLVDGLNRDHLTREELMFDPDTGTGTIWSFRFKEAAGSDWTSSDPWYDHHPCRKMVFLENGTVKMYVPTICTSQRNRQQMDEGQVNTVNRNDNMDLEEVQSIDMEDGNPTARPSVIHAQYNEIQLDSVDNSGSNIQDPAVPMTWRFVNQPLDFPDRPIGSYIRFSVRGREVPTYVCRRSPTDNWGFVLESCWGVYASFELPSRPKNIVGGSIRRRRRQHRLRRALNVQQGREIHFQVEVEDSSDDEEQEVPSGDDALVYDDYFNVSTELQWREAFLYNNFTLPMLPEGSGALADFRRNYGV